MKTCFRVFGIAGLAGALLLVQGCGEDPEPENIPEAITKVTLRFAPVGAGTDVTATASDPDRDGPLDMVIDQAISLTKGTTYTLSIELINELAKPTDAEYNVSEEVEEEGDEHMLFFKWSEGIFSDPAGTGNIPDRAGVVNYNDDDDNGEPIGLITQWTAMASASSGVKTFQIMLKHQPDLKSSTSTYEDGETDLDVTFEIEVK